VNRAFGAIEPACGLFHYEKLCFAASQIIFASLGAWGQGVAEFMFLCASVVENYCAAALDYSFAGSPFVDFIP
jgi:hypothetical protein